MGILERLRKTRDDGFTLIELVIVVAIVGILTAIAFPSYGAIQENARINSAETIAKNTYAAFVTLENDGDPSTSGPAMIAESTSDELTVSYNADWTSESDLCITVLWDNHPSIERSFGPGC